MTETRKLRVFLCHSSQDKPIIRDLYQRLAAEGWIDPWLDEEKLLPGQDWDMEIEKAVRATNAVIVCLSTNSVDKEGYVQHEIRLVLRIAGYKPEDTIFIIPIRLDNCIVPMRLELQHYVDFFPPERKDWAYQRLIGSLNTRYDQILKRESKKIIAEKTKEEPTADKKNEVVSTSNENFSFNKHKDSLANEKIETQNTPTKKDIDEATIEEKKLKDISFRRSEQSIDETKTEGYKSLLIIKRRLKIGLSIGALHPIVFAFLWRFSDRSMSTFNVSALLLGLIVGILSAWQINLIEKNQSGPVGGKAGLTVNAISGISHQLLLPIFTSWIAYGEFFNSADFFNWIGLDGLGASIPYLVPALIGSYISGYFFAKSRSNSNSTI